MANEFENAAKLHGETRVVLDTEGPIDVAELLKRTGYSFGYQRPRRAPDPWESVLAAPRSLPIEDEFLAECRRLEGIISQMSELFHVEVSCYPPGIHTALYRWSPEEGLIRQGSGSAYGPPV